MSQNASNSAISTDDILGVAKLSRLAVNADLANDYAKDLSKILSMMDILADVNTDSVAPLTNVHDMTQPLRDDVVDGNGLTVNRELNQSVAPSVQDGLFLVPQVIEWWLYKMPTTENYFYDFDFDNATIIKHPMVKQP